MIGHKIISAIFPMFADISPPGNIVRQDVKSLVDRQARLEHILVLKLQDGAITGSLLDVNWEDYERVS